MLFIFPSSLPLEALAEWGEGWILTEGKKTGCVIRCACFFLRITHPTLWAPLSRGDFKIFIIFHH
jgi:hypothetical protein